MDTKKIEIIGDNHEFFSLKTPLRKDAFVKTDAEKIKNIQKHSKARGNYNSRPRYFLRWSNLQSPKKT